MGAAGQRAAGVSGHDDDPGIEPALRLMVLQRGVRADEAAPGSGPGLAIVRDLADVYGGSIALGPVAAWRSPCAAAASGKPKQRPLIARVLA
jgi:nitrogen-specific signal transduction histidine kinase